MRVLLIADVHANWEALLALQRAEPKPDAVLFAGDAVGYGPDPANCVRWLKANTALAVRGNHDESLQFGEGPLPIHALPGPRPIGAPPELAEAARETLDYTRRVLSPEDMAGMLNWPAFASATLGGARFYLAHGTPEDPFAGQVNIATCSNVELSSMLEGIEADVIVLGHTHLPALRQFDGRLIVNPGSLGQPRYGVPDATYAVWEDGRVQIKHLHYDHEATALKLRLAPLSIEVIEQLSTVLEKGLL